MTVQPPAILAFIGIGNMGRPMARHLLQAGYSLRVYDTNAAAVRDFEAAHGATSASSPASAATGADVVITMLPDGKTVREVLLGRSGATGCMDAGGIVIDMSSSDPVGTRELGELLAKKGIQLIDAPVSGGVRRAEDGSLATMVGGDAATIERVRPILAAMAKQIFLTGSLGSGHAMKALNNLVSAGGFWIATEALLIGQKFGLAPATMIDVLNASTGRNNSTEVKFKQQVLSRAFGSGFSIGLMAKDLRTARDLAAATDSFAPFTELCTKLWDDAADEIGPAADHTEAARVLEAHNQNTPLK
jgi:3-hydroxyisobutyrate dehydrogenase